MRTIGLKICFLILPLAIAVSPLRAQTDGDAAATTPAAENTNTVTNVGVVSNGLTVTTSNQASKGHRAPGVVTVNHGFGQGGPSLPELAIITSMTFFLPVCSIALCLYYRHQQNAMLHQTLRLMIEKGVAIPPELLQPPAKPNPTRVVKDFRNGLILVGVGLALVSINFLDPHSRMGAVGLIPLFIGVAFLISWKLGQKTEQPGK